MPRLLVVDDTLDIQQNLRELLEWEGYAVTTASDGVEACAAARSAAGPGDHGQPYAALRRL